MVREVQDLAESVASSWFPRLAAEDAEVFHMFAPPSQGGAGSISYNGGGDYDDDGDNGDDDDNDDEWRRHLALVWSRSFLIELDSADYWALVPLAGARDYTLTHTCANTRTDCLPNTHRSNVCCCLAFIATVHLF